MSVTPSIRLIAWADRASQFVFVAVPDERGRYIRTDRSVVLVGCPMCKSIPGEPCRSKQGYCGMTHACRRDAAHALRGRVDDLIEPVDPTAPEPDAPADELPPVVYAEVPPIVITRKAQPGELVLLSEPRPIEALG